MRAPRLQLHPAKRSRSGYEIIAQRAALHRLRLARRGRRALRQSGTVAPDSTDRCHRGHGGQAQQVLVELLHERGIEIVDAPDEEFETMGPNVLALGPRQALALEGNDETRRRMESAGVNVVTYKGDEISRKGDGGPTCLTRPILRA